MKCTGLQLHALTMTSQVSRSLRRQVHPNETTPSSYNDCHRYTINDWKYVMMNLRFIRYRCWRYNVSTYSVARYKSLRPPSHAPPRLSLHDHSFTDPYHLSFCPSHVTPRTLSSRLWNFWREYIMSTDYPGMPGPSRARSICIHHIYISTTPLRTHRCILHDLVLTSRGGCRSLPLCTHFSTDRSRGRTVVIIRR